MPTVNLNKKEFEKLVGKKLPLEELKDRISMLGTDLEKIEGNEIIVEVFPNRPDMLSEQGFARAFSSFIGVKKGLKEYKVKKKAVPKIGKETEKFVNAIIDLKDENAVKDEFLFDIDSKDTNNFKEISIFNTYKIEEIVVDKKLIDSNPEKARLEAKRKGKLIRKIVIDGKESSKEYKMEV